MKTLRLRLSTYQWFTVGMFIILVVIVATVTVLTFLNLIYFVCLLRCWDWTQGLAHDKWVLYHWDTSQAIHSWTNSISVQSPSCVITQWVLQSTSDCTVKFLWPIIIPASAEGTCVCVGEHFMCSGRHFITLLNFHVLFFHSFKTGHS
jgi:hypothetical protein